METYHCSRVNLVKDGHIEPLHFASAVIVVHTEEDEFKSWFVDITAIENHGLIDKLLKSPDIHIYMKAQMKDGKQFEGEGYIHPNLSGQNATIRGIGELIGY